MSINLRQQIKMNSVENLKAAAKYLESVFNYHVTNKYIWVKIIVNKTHISKPSLQAKK